MFVWTLSFPLWTSKAIKAEAINAVWWLLLLFFFFNYCSMYKFSEHISTLNFCVKPEFHPGTSVWIVIKPIRSFNARSWAVSSPDYRMMLFPNPAVSSSARLLSWCCLCLSWRGCNSQEVGGVFSWPLRGAFKMKAWREDRRQLIIIWSPKKWNTANQMGFSLVILLCTRTLLIFLVELRVLLLFPCKLRLLLWASVFNFKGAYFDTLLVLAFRNFSYTIKAAIHHGICCHQEHLSLHNWGCCALLCWRWEGHENIKSLT